MRKTIGIFTLLLAIFLLTGLLESNLFSKKSYFFDSGNVFNMAKWTGLFGILAVGVCFVIITGGIDLSIGSLIGLTGALFVSAPSGRKRLANFCRFCNCSYTGHDNWIGPRATYYQIKATTIYCYLVWPFYLSWYSPLHDG